MTSTLDQLQAQARSMNDNNAMTKLGIDPDQPETLAPLVKLLENHELGATARAVLIQVRGALSVRGETLETALLDPAFSNNIRTSVPASSSISRAIPLAAVMNEHLSGEEPFTIYDLGAGRAHASRMFLHPELLERPFFPSLRMAYKPDQMPNVCRVVAVDSRIPSVKEATQVYYETNGDKTDKVRIMEELEDFEEEDRGSNRLFQVVGDIRNAAAMSLAKRVAGMNNVIFLNNVLYAVDTKTGLEICDAVNALASQLQAPIIQMEGWDVFQPTKPSVMLPSRDKPLGTPALVRIGNNLPPHPHANMRVVAELDGATGKPFILHRADGTRVFVNKNGEQETIA